MLFFLIDAEDGDDDFVFTNATSRKNSEKPCKGAEKSNSLRDLT